MRFVLTVLTACLLLAACGDEAGRTAAKKSGGGPKTAAMEIIGAPAVKTKRFDLAPCFEENLTDEAAASSRCPSFALLSLDYMTHECAAVGGLLRPVAEPVAWSLDVDGDASAEVLLDLTQNVDCQGAPGVFSCGSLGCPFFLYAKRNDAWIELGAINADDAPAIEVLDAPAGKPAPLRGGCNGLKPCSEMTHYEWNGKTYERKWIEFRGNPVDVAPGGLWTLNADTKLIAAPNKRAPVIDEYAAGTAVVVLGDARGAPYKLVSPCNACQHGFVEITALAR